MTCRCCIPDSHSSAGFSTTHMHHNSCAAAPKGSLCYLRFASLACRHCAASPSVLTALKARDSAFIPCAKLTLSMLSLLHFCRSGVYSTVVYVRTPGLPHLPCGCKCVVVEVPIVPSNVQSLGPVIGSLHHPLQRAVTGPIIEVSIIPCNMQSTGPVIAVSTIFSNVQSLSLPQHDPCCLNMPDLLIHLSSLE